MRDSNFTKHEIQLQELFSQFPLFFRCPGYEAQIQRSAEVSRRRV